MLSASACQRRYKRAPVQAYVNKIIGNEPHLSMMRNISAGGLYLEKLLEPDQQEASHVGLEFQLPGSSRVIWAVGSILRDEDANQDEGTAIQFLRLSAQDKEYIRQYVEQKGE
ncbi:MAG: PilZ domain-containing protein [Myxococcota bacterium]|nr:PilZ domain-containing protein [Myxococcota bacterium]